MTLSTCSSVRSSLVGTESDFIQTPSSSIGPSPLSESDLDSDSESDSESDYNSSELNLFLSTSLADSDSEHTEEQPNSDDQSEGSYSDRGGDDTGPLYSGAGISQSEALILILQFVLR